MRSLWICVALTCTVGCGQVNQKSELQWHTGPGPLRGHEDITRFAIDMANQKISQLIGQEDYFLPVPYGVSGSDTTHPIILGNFRSDHPDKEMLDFYNTPSAMEWHLDPNLQNIHALRNYPQNVPQSVHAACLGTRALVVAATRKAMKFWASGDLDRSLYFVGHATHIIEDSFSLSHSKRGGDDSRTIRDICTYGASFPGICNHGYADLVDRVWSNQAECAFNPRARGFDCLKDKAKSASRAAAGYLYAFFQLATNRKADADELLTRTFVGDPENLDSGYFDCDAI